MALEVASTSPVKQFSRGSEWRRWDLHVHTPASVLGSSFRGVDWDKYVDELGEAACNHGIAVIGVTDYMSIEGYCRLRDETALGSESRLSSVFMLLPNIEFRINPSTASGKAINIHLLIDPSSSDHIVKIRRALNNLKVGYSGENYGCSEEQLIEFGRAYKPECIDDNEALSVGIQQFKPDFSKWREWYLSETWLKDNSLVAVANGKDGISGLPSDGFGATREELLTLSDAIFSGTPNDRAHFLGEKEGISRDDVERMYGARKPCLHGSDAHDIESLFQPDEQRSCWIKADPTFEGLKQVLLEPEDRIWIGPTKPQQTDKNRVISSLTICGAKDWFQEIEIPLNDGLVAIIGEKGSGKTAIADLIAFAAGEPASPKSSSSFITKAKIHLSDVKVRLAWESGTRTEGLLPSNPHTVPTPLVRYLSQDFVERLCSTDYQGSELNSAIEEVVFSYLNDATREGYSSFGELRSAREAATQARRDSFRGQLSTLNGEIDRLRRRIDQGPVKNAQKDQKKERLEELRKQIPALSESMNADVLKELDAARLTLKEIDSQIDAISGRIRVSETALTNYALAKSRAVNEVDEIISVLASERGLKGRVEESSFEDLKPTWNDRAESRIATTIQNLKNESDGKQGDPTRATSGDNTRAGTSLRIRELEQKLSNDEMKRKRLVDLQKQIADTQKTIERLEREVAELDDDVAGQMKTKEVQREDIYLQFFQSLKADEQGLKELYEPMREQLDVQHSRGEMFELSVGYDLDTTGWLERLDRFFDGRRTGANTRRDKIKRLIIEELSPAWKSGDIEGIRNGFEKLKVDIDPAVTLPEFAVPNLQSLEIFDWMYSIDHVSLAYKILYGGIELENLSPGTRGIALLVLYLLMDEDDRRPLIIDQPEGNLDSASVYQQLVPYIREAKKKRQIILVSHNPNLVVATDADQIIIAKADKRNDRPYPSLAYQMGSLENIESDGGGGVRDQVCTILEGGARAFKERHGRYSRVLA